MNCDEVQRRILLARSFELPYDAERSLDNHIDGCEECRAYRDDMQAIVSAARIALPHGHPSAATLSNIRAKATDQLNRPAVIAFPGIAVRVLAYAAAVVIAVASWQLMSPAVTTPVDSENNIGAILACLQEDSYAETEDYSETSNGSELDELARQLLMMEGLSVDQLTEAEQAIQFEELQPTGLQSDSSHVTHVRKCV
jgi:hypothetical protein